jgi:RimJ/RimL family protein N-acetyltransferase
MISLQSERLILQELQDADAPFTLTLLNDGDFIEHIGDRQVRSLSQARAYLNEKAIPSYALNGFGMYAVRRKDTGETIGMCGLVKRDSLEDIDLGYGFLPTARGRGFALEAARLVVGWASTELGLRRLVAIVSPANKPSIRLLEKLDMQYESMIRLADEEQEVCLYALDFLEDNSQLPPTS